MALAELFWPKQDSLSVRENSWYEIQQSKRKRKRVHIPTSLFYSVSSLLDYVRQGFKETFDITYDEYEQKVIWKLKENASGVFKSVYPTFWPDVWDSVCHYHLQKVPCRRKYTDIERKWHAQSLITRNTIWK